MISQGDGALSKGNRSTSPQLCEQCQKHASALRDFFNTLVPRDRFDAPRHTCTLNLGLISHKKPKTCHLCAIIVDLRKCVDTHNDQTLARDEEVELSNVYTLSEPCFKITFRDKNTGTDQTFEYLRLCAYNRKQF